MEAGPEMDQLVAEIIMGWKPYAAEGTYLDELNGIHNAHQSARGAGSWHPSSNIAHAWKVLTALRAMGAPAWGRLTKWVGNGGYEDDPLTELVNQGDAAPLAICRAALLATDPSK
jgi:hypothetical protein